MTDLFAWATQPAPAPLPAPAADSPALEVAPPRPEPSDDEAPPAPVRRATWPRTLPTPAHLADPAFAAVFDAILPWWISDNSGQSYGMSAAEHVLVILDHLRDRGVLPPPPVPYD